MTLNPISVAIVDSGVHAAHPHINGVDGGAGIDSEGRDQADYVDRLGHGTAVTAVIREKAPSARVLCVKVFDRELAATGTALVAACDWALRHGAGIVNLSLGTANRSHETALGAAVARLRAAGSIIVAAGPDADTRWLPGALPGVWRVTLDWSLSRDECHARMDDGGEVEFRACGYPRPIPGVPPERNLKGLSFAVANVTGLLADWLARDGEPGSAIERLTREIQAGATGFRSGAS